MLAGGYNFTVEIKQIPDCNSFIQASPYEVCKKPLEIPYIARAMYNSKWVSMQFLQEPAY